MVQSALCKTKIDLPDFSYGGHDPIETQEAHGKRPDTYNSIGNNSYEGVFRKISCKSFVTFGDPDPDLDLDVHSHGG